MKICYRYEDRRIFRCFPIRSQTKTSLKGCYSLLVNRHHGKAKKQKDIEYKGDKCEFCGYSKCIWALEFHHINPELKLFEIGNNTFSWEKNQKELDKGILVCANCHREIESAGFI